MKLCTFITQNAKHVGLVLGSDTGPNAKILDLSSPEAVATLGFTPCCIESIIELHLDAVRELTKKEWPATAVQSLASLTLLAPLSTRATVLGVARNYHCACKQAQIDPPASPQWFAKLRNTLIGSGATIRLCEDAGDVTYEGEVALVIGKRARNVSVADAAEYIGGYTIVNDISGMSIVKGDNGNFLRGKNMDTFCPMGPFFVTADEITDPHNLRITLDVDGNRLQDGNSKEMVFNMFELVSRISQTITLEPGDVIAAGTPAGAAAGHTPPAWLRPGQEIRVCVQGLGELVNKVQ